MTAAAKFEISSLAALLLYLFVSLILFGLPVVVSPAAAHVGFLSDPSVMMWCIVWWPHAIARALNPFITRAIWAPLGYNLTWATSIPAVALALAPITAAFGPVVAYNLGALLAPALSAWSAFLLCRRVSRNIAAALAGGFVYGFSPYEVGHVLGGHLSLTPVFVPPLCVLLALLLLEGAISRRAFMVSLTLLLILQCLISTEILATMTLFGAVAILAAIALMPPASHSLPGLIFPIACAYTAAAALLTPFLYWVFANGAVPGEPIFPSAFFSADLFGLIVPGELMLVHQFGAEHVASRFAGNLWENGSYFSLPLLVVAALYYYPRRREGGARLMALLLLIISVAALGPVLHVAGRDIVTMPWAIADALPLIRYALPVRLGNYGFLVLAIMLSVWLAGPAVRFRRVLVVAVLVALIPNPAFLFQQSRYDTPVFFAQGVYRDYLERDDNVLVIPYGSKGPNMAWQAASGMYFRMPGGYIGVTPEDFRKWPLLVTLANSIPVPDAGPQLKAFAAAYKIDAIVVTGMATQVGRELPESLGLKAIQVGGVSVYRLPRHPRDAPTLEEMEAFQRRAADDWFNELLCAAQRFAAGGHQLDDLNPANLRSLGLLPQSEWSPSLSLLLAGAGNGTGNGLWIGPGADGTVAIGLPVARAAVAGLAARYAADTTSILYPYPSQYPGAQPTDESAHFLLMTLRPVALRHCDPGSARWSSTAAR